MNLGTLLLQLLVALAYDLDLFLALVFEQILQVFPQVNHLARSKVRALLHTVLLVRRRGSAHCNVLVLFDLLGVNHTPRPAAHLNTSLN